MTDDISELEAATASSLGHAVRLTQVVANGRNSRVYRAEGGPSGPLAVKQFYRHRVGGRDYLRAEHEGLAFLWRHGERRIPRPVGVDRNMGLLICEFVEGEPIQRVTTADIKALVEFLNDLRLLGPEARHAELQNASEACFSLGEIVDNIHERRQRLEAEGDVETLDGALARFLTDDFDPAVAGTDAWCRTQGWDDRSEEILPIESRALSPSDVGFHNCLRLRDGGLVFLDFEHFGWDDPAKTMADVCWHPAMRMTTEQARTFTAGMLRCHDAEGALAQRFRVVEPLFGLKWVTILLNEFVPSDMARRHFANGEVDRRALLEAQLTKAREMLKRVRERFI